MGIDPLSSSFSSDLPGPLSGFSGPPSTPEEASRFAKALQAQLLASRAQALRTLSTDSDDPFTATARQDTLTNLLEMLQQRLLGTSSGLGDSGSRIVGYSGNRAAAADPYGWRSLTRQLGDDIVGQGFGDLFERQINQESGYSPDVVLGSRLSSAGAEGIAQLMPQFYPNVNRLDPQQALTTSATTMADYLRRYDGDVRKALAAYNAGPGTVARLVNTYGTDWERGLPSETRSYLNTIVGTDRPRLTAGTLSGFSFSRMVTPASGQITQDFDADHHALDIGAAMGSPIRAATGGRVVDVQRQNTGYGWSVAIDHGGGLQTLYAHASAIHVRPGDAVQAGQVIAAVGSTVTSTGPHLHFEVRRNGATIDPSPYLRAV